MEKHGNSQCSWVITQGIVIAFPLCFHGCGLSSVKQVPEGKVVSLSLQFIDLESDSLCKYDYVDVYSGHVNAQRLGRFCGTIRPGALVSSANKMLVQMVSDANTAGSGFLAAFSAALPNERGGEWMTRRAPRPIHTLQMAFHSRHGYHSASCS